MTDIYKMNLHEIIVIAEDSWLHTTVMRVPGGWVYRSYDKSNQMMAAVFVPWSNEFPGGKRDV